MDFYILRNGCGSVMHSLYIYTPDLMGLEFVEDAAFEVRCCPAAFVWVFAAVVSVSFAWWAFAVFPVVVPYQHSILD